MPTSCSWICRFYIANSTDKPLEVKIKLMNAPGSFHIFYYPNRYYGKLTAYKLKGNEAVDFTARKELKPNTLSRFSHFKVTFPPRTAIEIGLLQNDTYKKYDQHFINGRVFNLEEMKITKPGGQIEIKPQTSDNYFCKGKNGEIYFVL